MNTKAILPIEYYIASLNYLYELANAIPNIHLGKHRGSTVLRIYNNTPNRLELSPKSNRWDEFYELGLKRQRILNRIKILEKELKVIYKTTYELERPKYIVTKNEKTKYTYDFYERLIDGECNFPNESSYLFDGHNYRSRFELATAQTINEMQISYKYECGLQTNKGTIYPDFALAFPAFNEVVFLEALGLLDVPEYAYRSQEKIIDYCSIGIYLNESLFVISSTKNEMPNNYLIQAAIVGIVTKLCTKYVSRCD